MVNFDQEIQMAKDNAQSAIALDCHIVCQLWEVRAKIWQARKDGDAVLANELQDEYVNL